jgi:hypothetical protein
LRRGLLFALALVGAQVLFQLLNLALVHIRGRSQRRRRGLFRRRFRVIFREHDGHKDEHCQSGDDIALCLLGDDAFGPDAFVAQLRTRLLHLRRTLW